MSWIAIRIFAERMEKYDSELAQKPEIIVLTKQDLVDEEELEIVVDLLRDVVGTKRILRCSSIAGTNIDRVKKYVWRKLSEQQ